MKWKICLQVGVLTLALAVPGIVIAPTVGYAQTQSKERRDDRQGDRQESRDTRQEGRQDARTQKAECKAGDEKTRLSDERPRSVERRNMCVDEVEADEDEQIRKT